eukprot:scaffold9150_cov120-Isochrysis_galbana.AAC.12
MGLLSPCAFIERFPIRSIASARRRASVGPSCRSTSRVTIKIPGGIDLGRSHSMRPLWAVGPAFRFPVNAARFVLTCRITPTPNAFPVPPLWRKPPPFARR